MRSPQATSSRPEPSGPQRITEAVQGTRPAIRWPGGVSNPNGEKAGPRPVAVARVQGVGGLQALPGQHHVVPGDVVVVRQELEPAELVGVEPDHAAVGQRALREVEPAVRPHDRHVGVVVAQARQAVEHGLASAARGPAADPARMAPLGDVEQAVVEGEAVHRPAQVSEKGLRPAVGADAPDPPSRDGAGERQAGLGDPGGPFVIEGQAGGEVQPLGDEPGAAHRCSSSRNTARPTR